MISRLLNSKLVREAAFYGLATAINRGLMLLGLPFLGKMLSIEDFGVWSLTQVLVSLGAPFISLNGSSGILREGIGNPQMGHTLFNRFSLETLKISVLAGLVLIFLQRDWIFYTVLMVLTEAFASLVMAWYRSQDSHILYFAVVFTRLLALGGAIFIEMDDPTLQGILFYQTLLGIGLLLPFLAHSYLKKIPPVSYNFRPVLAFCLHLLPHGFAQWVISGSDRIIIKAMLDDSALGHYSLAYTLSMSIVLINSGVGMTVGVDIIRDYQTWSTTLKRTKSIALYSAVFLAASVGLVGFITLFKHHIGSLENLTPAAVNLMPWILDGMYFMGIYLFFINYLNYLRESVLLSSITIISAILNVVLTIILIKFLGIEGAAIGTFVAYFALMALSMFFAVKKVPLKRNTFLVDIAIVTATVVVNHFLIILINFNQS